MNTAPIIIKDYCVCNERCPDCGKKKRVYNFGTCESASPVIRSRVFDRGI